MNAAIAPALAVSAGAPQVLAGANHSMAAAIPHTGVASTAVATVQTLLAQLEQVTEQTLERPEAQERSAHAPDVAVTEALAFDGALAWAAAMQPWAPRPLEVARHHSTDAVAVLTGSSPRWVGDAMELVHAPANPSMRADMALPARVAFSAAENSDAGAHLASQTLLMPVSISSPAGSARVATAAGMEHTFANAVPVQQGAQALVQALAQRLQVQQMQGQQVATVRLDPPQMGAIEVRISHDASGVQVHMQATNSEVGRQLAAVVDPLRQELLARMADAQIFVSTGRSASAGGQSDAQRQAQAHEPEPEIGQALEGAEQAPGTYT